jgi:hypothetical protein
MGSKRPANPRTTSSTTAIRRSLLEKVRAANRGGDVHLMLFGAGLRLTESLSPDTGLTFERTRALPGGSVEILYAVND